MNKELNNLEELLNFRSLMGLTLTEEKLKYIWGKKYLKSLGTETTQLLVENENKYVLEKIEICKRKYLDLKYLIGLNS